MCPTNYLIAFIFLVFLSGCELFTDQDKCKETETPEINFGLLAGGEVLILSTDGFDITEQFENENFTIMFTKWYCDGTSKGPFEEAFVLDKYGILFRQGIGTWSFRMDNTKDYMRIAFFFKGESVGDYNAYYEQLKSSDGGNKYFEFYITIYLDPTSLKVKNYNVQLVN